MKKPHLLQLTIVVIILVLPGFSTYGGSIAQKNLQSSDIKTMHLIQSFSAPIITEEENIIHINVFETNTYMTRPGFPILPILTQTYEFPLGTRIIDITYTTSKITEQTLHKKINSADTPFLSQEHNQIHSSSSVLNDQDMFYPKTWYTLKQHAGINLKNQHKLFVTIDISPVRYNSLEMLLQSLNSIDIKITYEEPTKPLFTPTNNYDLLIIAYPLFVPALKSLVQHKENNNLHTKLVSLTDIYLEKYFPVQGRDNPEKIKYFIKDACEQWNTTYVMLVGDFRKMPVRYSHLETDTGGEYEERLFLSDLYYADLYDANGNFSSWDSNNNGIFAEWPYPENSSIEDAVDLSPDVYIGRLACANILEVRNVAQKIIDYEQHTYGSSWFHTMVVCGGDTFDKSLENGTDYDEGEVANQQALTYMDGFTPVRLWASLGTLTTSNITNAITDGAGFIYFVGHGNPRKWATHNNGDYKNWTEDYMNKDILALSNKGKYPVLMVGGCHNSEFDVTLMNLFKNYSHAKIFSTWIPECWSWIFVRQRNGGAIASIGSTGYGGVNIGDANNNTIPDCVEGADGWFETEFFRLYAKENLTVLGEIYGQTVNGYVEQFPVFVNRYDAKIVETHVLFGDPSLKIGGYQS
ncbi:MAG: C25 family cysteine peptidase [Euryarchaeota archaeon]|nr:C25 family cysteine peptidase [Euryarchaeota archaeon]